MRRLNRKLVAVLACVFVLGIVLPGAWLYLRQRGRPNVAPMLEKAGQLLTEGKLDEAGTQYERVLRLDPRCAAAHQALGKLAEDRDDPHAAIGHYQRAVQHDTGNRALLTRLGVLGERLRMLEPIRTAAKRLLALEPNNAEAHCWKALVLNAEGKRDEAIDEAENATTLVPSFAKAYLLLGEFYQADQRHEAAQGALERGLEAHPEDVDLLLALGRCHEAREDGAASVEKARLAYEKAAKAARDRPEPRMHLAALLEKQQQFDGAEEQFVEATQEHPKSGRVLMAYAAFLDRRGRPAEAEAKRREAVEGNPDNRALVLAYAGYLAGRGRLGDARTCLEGALQRMETWHDGRARLVGVLLALRETQEARKQFDLLPGLAARQPAVVLLEGRLLLAEGKPGEAIPRLNQVIARDAPNAEAHFFLGLAFTELGALGSAQSSFQEAARHAPNFLEAQRLLAVTSLSLGQYSAAASAARKYAAGKPDDVGSQRLLARAMAASGDLEGGAEMLEAVVQQSDDAVENVLELADLYASAGRYDRAAQVIVSSAPEVRSSAEARLMLARIYGTVGALDRAEQELLEVCKTAPHDVRPRALLASVHYQRGDTDGAMALLEAFAKAEAASAEAQLLLAECYERSQKPEDAVRVCQAAEPLAKDTRTLLAVARRYRTLDRLDDALRVCRQASRNDAGAPGVADLEIALLLALKRSDEALAVARRYAASKPGRLSSALLTPRTLVAEGKLEEAIPLLRSLATEYPHEAAPAELLGRAYFLKKDYRKAMEQLRRAVGIRPNDPQTCFLLAEACRRSGEYRDAIAWSERVLARAPAFRRAREISAFSHAQREEYGEAIEEYLAAAPDKPDPGYLLRLAGLYERDGRMLECGKALLDAYRLEPASPAVVLALARHYEAAKKPDKAAAVISKLLAQSGSKPSAHLVAAAHHRSQSRLGEAEKAYRRAAKLDPKSPDLQVHLGDFLLDTGRPEAACEAYRAAVQLGQASAQAAGWPRYTMAVNNLAWCLAETGGDLDEAKHMAEEAVRLAPDSASALDTLGWICCKRKEYDEATRNLERSLKLRPESPTSHYHLAVALAEQGRSAEARVSLTRALKSKSPFNRANDARELLKQLDDSEPR